MKLKSFINKIEDKIETETYGLVYIKYRKFVLDGLMFLCILFPLIFGLKLEISYVFLVMGFMIAMVRLEQTVFEIVKANKEKTRKKLTEGSALEEAKEILKKNKNKRFDS